jgi:hypothetical protein
VRKIFSKSLSRLTFDIDIKLEDTKGIVVNQRTDNMNVTRKRTKEHKIIYKTMHRTKD